MSEAGEPDANAILGTMQALVTFAQVLARTSPTRETLLSHLNAAEQMGLATIEALPVHEKVVEGYQSAIEQIRQALRGTTFGMD